MLLTAITLRPHRVGKNEQHIGSDDRQWKIVGIRLVFLEGCVIRNQESDASDFHL